MTTEAMVRHLARQRGIPHVWAPDEFGMIIAEVGKREFLSGIEELLLSLYGKHTYEYMTVQETVTILDCHLSVLGSTTPEALALAGPTAMLGGLLPRFAIVYPTELPPTRPVGSAPDLVKTSNRLVMRLRRVMQTAQESPDITFTPAALKLLNAIEVDLPSKIYVARLPAMLYKVSALSALSDYRTLVDEDDARSAGVVIGHWADSAMALQPFLRQKATDIEYERHVRTVADALAALGGRAKKSAVARAVTLSADRLNSIERTLLSRALIKVNAANNTWTLED